MNRGAGYTIVEAIIFLGVSGFLLVSAMIMMNGSQRRTEFTQSIRDIDSKIRDVINDVATGVYNNTGNFRCTSDNLGNPPILTTGSNNQGSNAGCVFIGRTMQFGVNGDKNSYYLYDAVGRQYAGTVLTSPQVKSIAETKPRPISPSISFPDLAVDSSDKNRLDYGLEIGRVTYDDGGGATNISSFGFFSNFINYSSNNDSFNSAKQSTDVYAFMGPQLAANNTSKDGAQAIVDMTDPSRVIKNPRNGITICFNSAGTNQHGIIIIGGNGQKLTTNLTIKTGSCP